MLTRRSQSASTPDSGSCERLQKRRRSSSDINFAYDNSSCQADVATAAAEPTDAADIETIEMTMSDADAAADIAEPADDVEDRISYELAAAQASCWLRQLICSSAAATVSSADGNPDEDISNAEVEMLDGETLGQLESISAQFNRLSPSSRLEVPQRLQPSQLQQLRGRQQAVCACFAEARSLCRHQLISESAQRAELLDRLRSCRERLDLVAKCAARLGRQQRLTSAAAADNGDKVDGEGESETIDRDRRLVRDSAARARRNVDDLLTATTEATAKATFSRQSSSRRLLVDCADCLRCRADRLAKRDLDESVGETDEAGAEAALQEANDVRLLTRVESRLSETAAGVGGRLVLECRRLRQLTDQLELTQLLLSLAKDLCNDECNGAHVPEYGSNIAASTPASPTSSGLDVARQTASDWLHRKQRLEKLETQLGVAMTTLSELLELSRARLAIRRNLDMRSVMLRHLREMVDAGQGRLKPEAFLYDDNDEAVTSRLTNHELLTAKLAKLDDLARRIRDRVEAVGCGQNPNLERILKAEEELDRRHLEAAQAALQALRD